MYGQENVKKQSLFQAVRFDVIFMFSSHISTLFVSFNKTMHAWSCLKTGTKWKLIFIVKKIEKVPFLLEIKKQPNCCEVKYFYPLKRTLVLLLTWVAGLHNPDSRCERLINQAAGSFIASQAAELSFVNIFSHRHSRVYTREKSDPQNTSATKLWEVAFFVKNHPRIEKKCLKKKGH